MAQRWGEARVEAATPESSRAAASPFEGERLDRFAAAALAGLLARPGARSRPDAVAREAVAAAHALLAALRAVPDR